MLSGIASLTQTARLSISRYRDATRPILVARALEKHRKKARQPAGECTATQIRSEENGAPRRTKLGTQIIGRFPSRDPERGLTAAGEPEAACPLYERKKYEADLYRTGGAIGGSI